MKLQYGHVPVSRPKAIRKKKRVTKGKTPFETMFPPIKDKKLPKDGAAYLL